ncbi:MAG: hypothetical protein RBS68_10430 [Anaerolineales bacterium]|jgi:hypothetical protein|nr:hypothetical protein [Anaerolineales bacterium]
MNFRLRWIISLTLITISLVILLNAEPVRSVAAQQPTGSIPTVTGTPTGAYIKVIYEDQINIRSGPNSYWYPAIGVLLWQQESPALGRSPGGDWIQISYPGVPGNVGWVYAPLVSLGPPGVSLQIVEPPPTPTPATTPTIDPTLAAAFLPQYTPTRMATFTPPAPLIVPTYEVETGGARSIVPTGLVITLLTLIGAFGAFISFLRGR